MGPGHSVMIVVGGAGESLNARPGIYNLVLKRRLGFIKLSIRTGACLVPVFSFGENDIWEQADNPKESKVWKFQKLIQKYIGWTMPLFHGRGLFNYDVGVLPHRRQIVTVGLANQLKLHRMTILMKKKFLKYKKNILKNYLIFGMNIKIFML
jgi:2-acylglycerol O-acyltransferase 2